MQGNQLTFYIIAAVIVLMIPGGALLAWNRPRTGARRGWGDPVNGLADASALSMAVAALLGLAGYLLGLRFSGAVVAVLYGFCAAVLAGGLVWRWISAGRMEPVHPIRYPGKAAGVIFALVLVSVLVGWRLFQARELALPAWVDSVHHTLVVRVILENGGVPANLEPYLPVPLIFHFGFHLSAALFAFWSGAPVDQAVLWFGQVLNALVALSAYRAAGVFIGDGRAGMPETEQSRWQAALVQSFPLIAALLVGFAFQMPGYYLTWGRFTLLAGLLLLGPAIAAAMDAWDDASRMDAWVRLTLLIAGLALTHIFTLVLAAIFLALLGAAGVVRGRQAWGFLARLAGFSLLGLLLAAPWIGFTLREGPYEAAQFVNVVVDTSEAALQRALDYLKYLGYLTGPRRSHILLGFAGVGLLAALLHPRRRLFAAWAVLLVIASLPWGVRNAPFRADYFAIILFFPAAILLGGLLIDCVLALGRVTRPWLGGLSLLLVVGSMVGWGVRETRNIINPVTVIATPADVLALDWIEQNTPPDARFYTNSVVWQTGTYRGVDGGYWLAPYAGRGSLVPPVFYVWGSREYVDLINNWAQRSAEIQGCTPEFWDIVREAGLTYVYLREGTGSLQPAGLANCPRLQEVYQAEGVHIYSILHP